MVWSALTFAYNEILASSKMNLLQDNFTALASQASGSPVLHPNKASVLLTDNFNTNSTSFVTRTGATVSITLRGTACLLMVRSVWHGGTHINDTNLIARINLDSGTYRNLGMIGKSNSNINGNVKGFIGGTTLFTGLTSASHTFVFEVKENSGLTVYNNCSEEEYVLEMIAMEV